MSNGILSLCTGYAGLDLAVESVTGARTIAVSDLDRGANKILAHRMPHVPNLGDLKLIDWSQWVGTYAMTAGYPCQPFSHAGKREGTDDPRHIFPFIAEGIRIVGPRLVVLENVRGHLALGFDTVLGTLADIGYDARWVCVRASDVGAPHRRERLFIVATPRDADGSGLEGRPAVERADERSARAHGLVDRPAAQDADGAARGERRLAAPGQAEGGRSRSDAGRRGGAPAAPCWYCGLPRTGEFCDNCSAHTPADTTRHARRLVNGDGATFAHAPSSAWRASQSEHLGAPTGPAAELGERTGTDWGQYAPAIHRWAAALGRPAPAPTEPGAKGQPRLSPRFVEFMMGLPEGWVTDVPDLTRNEQLKALGNGVVPQQAAAALAFLLNAEERAA